MHERGKYKMEENKQTEEAKEVKNEQTAETPKKDVA